MALSAVTADSYGETLDTTYNPAGINRAIRVTIDSRNNVLVIEGPPDGNGRREQYARSRYVFGSYDTLTSGQVTILSGYIQNIMHLVTGESPA